MASLRTDAEVRQDVVDALTCDIRIDASQISVDVVGHLVTLRGAIPSYYEKRTAGDLVRRIKGVRDVRNELRVLPSVPRSDEAIAADVRAALTRNTWVDESAVQVRVVSGVVYLLGAVDTYNAKSYAEGEAWSVPGVVDVVDQIAIHPVTNRTDTEIAHEVRTDVAHNLRVDPQRIQVDVRGGTVYLRGNVSSLEQKWLADEIAWWTAGVRDVVNELGVEPPAQASGGAR
jgi:osmotically-inducible protein OsmY